jgi:AraC family transcriptional regulator of adaptative response / DNA-3-methyladenine glycosylase II
LIRGVGPWTAAYVAMRALGDPDVLLPGDVALRRAFAERRGLVDRADRGGPRALADRAERWRPWRSYAVHHLWASLADLPARRPRPAAPRPGGSR